MLFSFLRQIIARLTLSLAYGVARPILQTAGALVIMLCLSTPASAQQRIVALGDSLSAGYLLPQKNAFPTVLERVLRETGQIVQSGAQEVDLVLPYAQLLQGNEAVVAGLLATVRKVPRQDKM